MKTLIYNLEDAYNISTKPDRTKFNKYKETDVIDEEKSVRWNREEIQRRNKMFLDEVARLQRIRSKAITDAEIKIQKEIISELDNKINSKQAKIIYDAAWSEGHSGGTNDFYIYLERYIDFVDNIFNAK